MITHPALSRAQSYPGNLGLHIIGIIRCVLRPLLVHPLPERSHRLGRPGAVVQLVVIHQVAESILPRSIRSGDGPSETDGIEKSDTTGRQRLGQGHAPTGRNLLIFESLTYEYGPLFAYASHPAGELGGRG